MKGTKGMQQKVILFLMFVFGISNNALSLDIGKSGAFFEKASSLYPNVATIADMVFEKPNEAFLPDISETISYEMASVDDDIFSDDSVDDLENKQIIAKAEDNIKKAKVVSSNEKTYVSSLLPIDVIKPEPKINHSISRIKKNNDKFANIKVAEGEEVLVSTSEQPKKIIDEKVIKTNSDTKKVSVEKTVAKLENPVAPEIVKSEEDSDNENPFGVIVSKTKKDKKVKNKTNVDIAKASPFVKAFSAMKPEAKISSASEKKVNSKPAKKSSTATIASSEILKKDLHRTYLSGNQYLSAYEDENEEELEETTDEEIEENEEENEEEYQDDEGFAEQKDVEDALEGKGDKKVSVEKVNVKEVKEKLQTTKKTLAPPSGPLKAGTREVLNMKIDFQEGSSAVSGESVNLIRSFAQIATEQPTNSIEITIPESVMSNLKKKKLTARRLSIVSNILRNAGISEKQILPVLTNRDENSFAFRVVNNDVYTKLRVSKGSDIFGEDENVKEYNIMKW